MKQELRKLVHVAAICLIAIGCKARRARVANADPVQASAQCAGVMTSAGCVRGSLVDKLMVFRGIPYAAPPVGALRWKAPAPLAAWQGVRDATAFGKSCPQLDDTIGGKLDTDEDCLTLNIWTPKVAAKLPVMFWIHGGSLTQGGSAIPAYDGQHLAALGNVVVVSINYRLGPLGFLAHPTLSSGNLGLKDQIAALEWVRANIDRFGGDPNTVTIFGESAGGESVCALMASPRANKLFARAVIESAQCPAYGQSLRALKTTVGTTESGEAQGLRIAKALGCDGEAAATCMRGKTASEIIHASPAGFGFLGKGEHYGLTVDGDVLLDAPATLLATDKLADVPLIIGTNADEGTLFTVKLPVATNMAYVAIVAKIFPGHARQVLAQYAPAAFGSAKQAFDALVSDVVFTCPTRRAARALTTRHVYRYLFAHVTAKGRETHLGATHGSEIPFVFDTMTSPTDDERALATTMLGYWTRFARTGDPNGAGSPSWPAYSATNDDYLELETPIAARAGLRTTACDLLDSLARDRDGSMQVP